MFVIHQKKDTLQSQWRTYVKGFDTLVRPLTAQKLQEMRRRHTTTQRHGFRSMERVDDDAFNAELFPYLAEDWRGPVNEEGESLPCTPENVMAAVQQSMNYADWLLSTAISDAEGGNDHQAQEQAEAGLGN